ncbi:hypothetical protein C8R47DRAFT_1328257 [Mycena vitilis]|nr:hypothetical protein C8R47DRAFT_1328257 [Mycena vitilis]
MSSAFLTPISAAPGMRIRGVDIPNDVLASILASAPDFDTLHAAVRVCNTWHRVFETHPKSVLLAVARNVAGPALAQAMCVVRYPYPEKTPNDWGNGDGEDGDEMEVDDPEATEDESDEEGVKPKPKKAAGRPQEPVAQYESASIGQLTPKERMQLQENAATVRALENIFSLRYKDRTSTSSTLPPRESHRFARAMYRIMTFCALFYLPLNLDDIDSMADEDGTIDAILDARHAHLDAFPTDELLQLRAVVAFLHELIGEVLDDEEDAERASNLLFRPLGLKDICLATGPEIILAAYRARTTDAFEAALEPEMLSSGEDNALYGAFFEGPLARIWEERGVVVQEEGVDAEVTLDGEEGVGVGREEKCAQCGLVVSGDARLWTESTWPTLISIDFCALLPGKLNENEVEAAALVPLLMDPNRGAAVVLREIFDDDLLAKEYKGKWGKRDALCGGCLDKLVGAHLHLWLYERKVEDGWKPTQNCWYGYNCKTQVHKIAHARDKNNITPGTWFLSSGLVGRFNSTLPKGGNWFSVVKLIYANLDLRVGLGKTVASIVSIPTAWQWTYSSASSELVADVSYDLWLSKTAGTSGASSSSTFEIMVWLSTRGGAGPAGSQIGTATVNGVTWRLFKGTVSTWTVFSFVAPTEITNFNSDLKHFLSVPSSQFLVQAQAGTEPFIGSATLTTNSYSISIN